MRDYKSQSLSEYSICLALILMTLLGMQYYMKRGLQGRYKDLVDNSVTSISENLPSQYEPVYRKDLLNNITDIDVEENLQIKGKIEREITKDTSTQKGTLTETVDCYEDEEIPPGPVF